jgi:hypothetical protein
LEEWNEWNLNHSFIRLLPPRDHDYPALARKLVIVQHQNSDRSLS